MVIWKTYLNRERIIILEMELRQIDNETYKRIFQ